MRRWRAVSGIVLAVLIAAGSVGWWLFPRGPNVLLITLDTTRADRLGCYGYQQARTSFLDQLGREGIVFENALTNVPVTLPSHATMLTGLLPPEHGLRNNGIGSLPKDIPTLAEQFSARGYRTGAFLGSFMLDRRFGLDRGFSKYDDDMSGDDPTQQSLSARRTAGRVVDSALAWLLARSWRPYFCWVHVYDPHHPCSEHRSEFGDQFSGRGYDGELAYVDQELKRLTDSLRRDGLLDNTWIIVVGDHGEALGEHDEPTHGMQLYQSTQHVPFISHWPARYPTPRRVPQAVGLNELFVTMADCLGWRSVPVTKVPGRSLRPALEGRPLTDSPIYCETWQPFFALHCSPQAAVVSSGWKYIRSPQPELYDLAADSRELQNQVTKQSSRATEMLALLTEIESKLVPRMSGETRKDTRLEASLQSLGYSGGSRNLPTEDRLRRLPDVKTLIRASRVVTVASDMGSDEKQTAEVISLLEGVVRSHPDYHVAKLFLAFRLAGQGQLYLKDPAERAEAFDRAERLCREVLEAERDWPEEERNPKALAVLAGTLFAAGKNDEAEKVYGQAAQAQAQNPTLFADWARLLVAQNKPQEAIEKYKVAVGLSEGLFTAQYSLADLLLKQSKSLSSSTRPEDKASEQRLQGEALRHFELAARHSPKLTAARYQAASILMARGQFPAAAEHLAKIAEIDMKDANVRYLWASALASQQKYEQAAELLRTALKLDPNHEGARRLLQLCEQ